MSINRELFTNDGDYEHPRTPTLPGLEESAERRNTFREKQLSIITNIKSLQNSPVKRKNSRYSVYSKFSPKKQILSTEDRRAREPMSSLLPQSLDKEYCESRPSRSSSSYSSGLSTKYFNEINILKTKIKKIIKNQEPFNTKLFKQGNEVPEPNKVNVQKMNHPKTPIEDAYNFSFSNSFNIKNSHMYISKKFPREIFCKMSKDRP